jgi:serine protease Do
MNILEHSKTHHILLFCLAFVLVLSGEALGAQASPASQNILDQLNSSLKELAHRVSPAVVEVQTWAYQIDDDDDNVPSVVKSHLTGSGVILDSMGYIVTNAHVVNGAKRVRVTLNPPRRGGMPARTYMEAEGRSFDATVVGADLETDLAVLKIQAEGLPTIQVANYEHLQQGQMVIALGNPLGMRNAATIGIVSSVARQIDPDSSVVYIQTDAALNPGNSGGALVDTTGHLVGINAATMNGEKLGLAIPSDTVKLVYEQIRASGRVHQGDVGLRVQTITPTMAAGLKLTRDSGVIVSDVRSESPAEKAGIQPQDIIMSADRQPMESALEFATLLRKRPLGERVPLELLRGEKRIVLEVTIDERPAAHDLSAQVMDPAKNVIIKLGVLGLDVDPDVANTIPGIRQRTGVLVTGRLAKREGVEGSLKVGDVIHAVNGLPVATMDDIRNAVAGLGPGSAVVLKVERQRTFVYVVSEME